jgi:hypothetical protein
VKYGAKLRTTDASQTCFSVARDHYVAREEINSAHEKSRQCGGLCDPALPEKGRDSLREKAEGNGLSTFPAFKLARSAYARRLHRGERRLDAAPICSGFAIALGFASRRPLGGFQHGPLAAHFMKLSRIVQDFESLHHLISIE